MEFEFDKEIDVLLRQTAQGGDFVSSKTAAHLDADDVSAFAENALPEKIKRQYTLHLADCDKCRKNLSNLIALTVRAEPETTNAKSEIHFAAAPVPWYRRLFAVPNLAYTLGALVLVFSGIAAFTILQSVSDSPNSMVSQTQEKQPGGQGMSSDGDALPTETYSSNTATVSNMMTANTSATNTTANTAGNFSNPAMPSAPVSTANSNSSVLTTSGVDKDLKPETKSANQPLDLAKSETSPVAGAALPAPAKENEYQEDGEVSRQQNQAQQNTIVQNQTDIMPDSRNVKRAPVQTQRAETKRKVEESRDDSADKSGASLTSTTSVGGKTFRRDGGVWYDAAYRGQKTTNITRGTQEYKKLDAGLRGIVENLGGTVVVVWKDKAYRIQ
jgi:hypothetical protein